ncbi:FAD-dependent monooxygenase [Silvibacterium acidisoli]|uniref:FAD-dependent monooxygenase n=1 Tax=Acidobacteriaceae bacterium ZG23-2 TaxID=2883246 RepID=UPI00406C5A1A
MANVEHGKVLIIGAGPTGMTAAMELSRMKIPVRIVERAPAPATTSRAIGVQARTLELFQQRSMVDPMLAKGNASPYASVYGGGKRTFRLAFSNNGSRYGYMLFISQAETEGVLRDALERQQVKIEREVDFVALAQSDRGDSVKAILRHRDGTLEEYLCDYLIDTEGAHSVTRTTLNLEFHGKTREESYALGDFYVDGDLPATDLHIFSSPHGFMGLFPMGGNRFRMIASHPLSEPDANTEPSLDELQKIYDQRSHIPVRLRDLQWSSWFRINSRMVDRVRVGRVFLGGDAAHIHSPAGAQGMNTGIQDMINLCWKLALVIHGKAGDELLQSYNDERIPVIHDVLTKTEGLTDAIGSESPAFRAAFSTIAPWIVGTEFMQENSTQRMSQLLLNYRRSPLSVSKHEPGQVKAGDRVPDVELTVVGGEGSATREPEKKTLFDLLSPDRFTLLFANLESASATHQNVKSKLAAWKELISTYSVAAANDSSQAYRHLFGSHPALVFVRPDGYAAFTGREDSIDDLEEWLRTWFTAAEQPEKELRYA